MNVDQKIKELESQVSLVQKELESLKNYVHNSKEIAADENTGFINENNITARPQSKLQQSSEQSTLQNPEQSSQQNSQKERVSVKTSSSSNVESILGKYFMGIAASVLIFIALILFGVLIYRNFTDVMKLIAIYGISTALLLSGCLMLRKKRNAFLLSLTGCGLGAFYTSMILTYTYFHRINDITLYFMLVAWTIAVIFIARQYHAMMISIIGQCGILIASLFGLSVVDSDAGFLLLSIFIVVSTSMFLLLECSIYKQRMQCFFILTDAFLLFITGIFRIFARGHHIPLIVNTTAIILLAYSFFLFLFFIRKVLKQSSYSLRMESQFAIPTELRL